RCRPGWRHPGDRRVLDLALHVPHPPTGIALIPRAIELFGGHAKLNDEVAGQVLWLGLAPFFAPEADQGGLVATHYNPGVRAADEGAAILVGFCPHGRLRASALPQYALCWIRCTLCRFL